MANALATLFGDIAAAIKAKNGEEGVKYKPIEFPAKIASIPEAKDTKLTVRSGMYIPDSLNTVTITHNLGVLPDVVIVFLAKLEETVTLTGATNAVGGQICYSSEAMADGAVGYVYNLMGSNVDVMGYSIYDENKDLNDLGCVRAATPRTFKIGGSTAWPVTIGASYQWIAVGGLKAHPTYLDLRLELDGEGGLIVHGGVPGIKQLAIYVDGTLGKTVDYVHGGSFTVPVLDVAPEARAYTFSVKPIGDGLDAAYPYQFFESVSGTPFDISMEGTCGENVTFNLDNTGTMTISGTGDMADYATADEQPWASSGVYIRKVVISDGITKVGKNAFNGCTAATALTIGKDVTNLDNNCFRGCTSLANVTLPDNLQRIGSYAFYGAAITSITIPYAVTTIGAYAFYTSKLTSWTLRRNNVTWYGYSYEGATSSNTSKKAGYFYASTVTTSNTAKYWWCPAS